ncbi:hypothetical protein FRC17_002081 [Serendipita sp. 399]|nr:hypothetical protein FRC17_002081 [Serendipita sp. 399]
MPTEGIPILFSPLQAILVLFIVFIVPISLLLIPEVGTLPAMLLESLGLGFLWNKSIDDEDANYDKRRTKRKKIIRTRAEHISQTSEVSSRSTKYYPGLVNISGTYCFLNATLQALASLCYLQPFLDNMYTKAELFDVSTPVLDALVAQLHGLNTPSSKPTSSRPTELIHALSTPTPGFRRGALFASREHQDAQELFQLLTEKLKEEALAIDKEAHRDRGLSSLEQTNQVYLQRPAREPGKGVFEGLTANRRSCTVCGYTEAVMHFTFDNLQLSVPRRSQCTLEECLGEYTRMELLKDCICRKCSMMATLRKLEAEVIKISTPVDGVETTSRKKRTKDVKKLATRVKTALDSGTIEEDIKGERMVEDGGWLRISDETVREVGLEAVLSETSGAFMLFYEKILPFQSESLRTSPRSSQETVTPHQEERKIKLEDPTDSGLLNVFNARIVRSVSVGNRSREGSVINGNPLDVKPMNGDATHRTNSHSPIGSPELPVSPKVANGRHYTQEVGSIPNGNSSPTSFVAGPSPIHRSPHSPDSPVRAVDLVA